MDPKLKHIVEVSDLLTQAEIKNYASGVGLSQAERYRIELKITNNPANQDLLDAFADHPNLFKGFDNLQNPLNDHSIEYLISFTSLFIIILLAAFNFWPKDKSTENLIQLVDVKNVQIEKFERSLRETEEQNTNLVEFVKPKVETPDETQIQQEFSDIEWLESKSLKLIDSNRPDLRNIKIQRKYPSVYLGKFKTTDYRNIRVKESIEHIALPGLSADFENDKSDTLHDSFDRIPEAYIDHLRIILRGFQTQNFNEIIKPFSLILKEFPNDDNALFYRGLSYYHLDQTELSIRDLKAVLENSMSNFDEEAEWYLALNYQKSGQTQKLKSALEAIINRQAFYAKEAKKRYQLCKN